MMIIKIIIIINYWYFLLVIFILKMIYQNLKACFVTQVYVEIFRVEFLKIIFKNKINEWIINGDHIITSMNFYFYFQIFGVLQNHSQ
jgi:hypothetical protein